VKLPCECRGAPSSKAVTSTHVANRPGLWLITLALLISTGFLTSCAMVKLKHQVKQLNAHGVVALHVSDLANSATNYALALSKDAGGTNAMVGFQVIDERGLALFLLREDRVYDLGAFSDLNGDGMYDGNEPAQLIRNIRPTDLSSTTARPKPFELTLSTNNDLPRGQTIAMPSEDSNLGEALAVSLGNIADLDQPQFSSAIGELGMWQPYAFIKQYGFGVYFLEPYTPKKTPVLFVYGISGSFQDWRVMLEKMDRRKYQPWLVFYPSGLRLDRSANVVCNALLLLRQRYGCQYINVVAHSMGGLVSRGAIQRAVEMAGTNFIRHFVTISTPWGGHQAAELAVKHLDFPVPSWRDMAPGSEYLKEILSKPLPTGTRHDMLFSYKSSRSLGLPDENDGVVAVQSELLPKVQEQASSVLGLYESHMSILATPIALRRVEQSIAH
jgi:pimeloyl-ACP methyl ester carboxylesterase